MTEYVNKINTVLKPQIDSNLKKTVIDLFAGCGGLSLGFESVGFKTIGYEILADASATYNKNLIGNCYNEEITLETIFPNGDVLIGGPPCQPFSVGGKQLGLKDSRDGFPLFLNAIEKINPEIIVIENVRGLLFKNKWYLNQILNEITELGYEINYRLLNAKNFGVPQNRERVIILASKKTINFPAIHNKFVTAGHAVSDLIEIMPENPRFLTSNMDKYIAKYEKASKCIKPRDLYLDQPARTLTCRNLAGATGDMHRIKLKDGSRRRLTTREAARLQSFPDWFEFTGNETGIFNQIGNAVAPLFARELALKVKEYFIDIHDDFEYKTDEFNQSMIFHEKQINYQS
jgi:DNA (cytosine-5)-methyltransferase 1